MYVVTSLFIADTFAHKGLLELPKLVLCVCVCVCVCVCERERERERDRESVC